MLRKLRLIGQRPPRRSGLVYVLICGLLGALLTFVQPVADAQQGTTSGEEGLQQRQKRTPRRNTAQMVAAVPYYIIRLPIFLVGQGVKQSLRLVRTAPGLIALYPTVSFGGQGGFTGRLTLLHKSFLKHGNELRLRGAYSVSSRQRHSVRYRAYNLIGPVDAQIRGRFHVDPKDRFFGIGPDLDDVAGDGDEADETNFRHEQLGGDFIVGATWQKFFRTEVFANITKHINHWFIVRQPGWSLKTSTPSIMFS